MTDALRSNAVLVDALGSALRSGDHAFGAVPGLLKQVLEQESWREFTTQRGAHITHERFEDFVTTPPLAGLGADLDLIRRIISADPKTLDLLDGVLRSPWGTSPRYALRRLRKERPDLHEQVLEGLLSPHGAMVQAGLRKKTITLPVDLEAAARTIRRHFSDDERKELARLLG